MIRAAWLVAAKDLRLFFRDRVALLVTFALPMVLATVFGGDTVTVKGTSLTTVEKEASLRDVMDRLEAVQQLSAK